MHEIEIAEYYEGVVTIQQAIGMATEINASDKMTDAHRVTSADMLDRVNRSIIKLPLPVTKLTIGDLQAQLRNFPKPLTYFECGQLLVNLSQTMRRELQSAKVFSLDTDRSGYYEPQEPLFGTQVEKQFPDITYEIDQAGKCYACDLTTAAAFHSIRCLEAGIRAIARCLGIADPTKGKDRNWSNLSRSIKDEMDRRWPASSGRMSGDAQLFDALYGSVSGMQNPYRNETMHLSAKYTPAEALHIMELVKGLMQRIASRMDHNGDPRL